MQKTTSVKDLFMIVALSRHLLTQIESFLLFTSNETGALLSIGALSEVPKRTPDTSLQEFSPAILFYYNFTSEYEFPHAISCFEDAGCRQVLLD